MLNRLRVKYPRKDPTLSSKLFDADSGSELDIAAISKAVAFVLKRKGEDSRMCDFCGKAVKLSGCDGKGARWNRMCSMKAVSYAQLFSQNRIVATWTSQGGKRSALFRTQGAERGSLIHWLKKPSLLLSNVLFSLVRVRRLQDEAAVM